MQSNILVNCQLTFSPGKLRVDNQETNREVSGFRHRKNTFGKGNINEIINLPAPQKAISLFPSWICSKPVPMQWAPVLQALEIE